MIGGIVMAAGLSERMDGPIPKQLLPVSGRPMVAVTVGNAVASLIDEVVVVTGYRGAEVAAAVADLGALVVDNPDYREGNMTSFRAGYHSLPECDAYVVLLADMPEITTEMINSVVDTWLVLQPWAAVSEYVDGPRHPLLLSADAMQSAASATGPKAVWRLLDEAEPGSVATVDFAVSAPRDINTAVDYEELIAGDGDRSAE